MIWGLVAVLGVVIVVGLVAGYRLSVIARDLRQARDLIERAGTQIENGELAAARDGLEQAEGLLVAANGRLYNAPELTFVSWVPVVHENLISLKATVGVALELVTGGHRILTVAAPLENADGDLEIPLRAGAIPLHTVRELQFEVAALARSLPGEVERPGTARLVGAVAEAQERVFDEAVSRREQLGAVARGLTLLSEMAGGNGPRRYLIAVANTAEMRGSGGMILSYGVLEGAGGDFELPAFGNIDELFLQQGVDPATTGVSDDELERWAGLEPTRLWRNVNLVPDTAAIVPRMAAMYEAATGLPVDGVIQIDADGLAALLEGIGPVNVEGLGEVNAANAVARTLNEAYLLFPDRDQRQEVLGDVAEATFRRLVDGEYDSLRPLGEALIRAADERHIIIRSSSADVSGPAAFFHADGELPAPDLADHALLTVQNFSRNKLDYYLDTAGAVTGSRLPGELSTLQFRVTVTNTAPPGQTEPEYVFGDGSAAPPGVYRGVVSLYIPIGAVLTSASGYPAEFPGLLVEDGRSLVTWDIEVPAGGSSTVTLDVRFPPRVAGAYQFDLAPLPRVRPTIWDIDIDLGDGQRVQRTGPLVVAESLRVLPR